VTPATNTPAQAEPRSTEESIKTYELIAEWIRFADAKAAVTLTVNGVLLGLLIPTLKTYLTDGQPRPTVWWPTLVVLLVWLALLVLSAVQSFLCILPIRGPLRRLALDRSAHFHPAAVAQHYSLADLDRFVGDCEQAGTEGLRRQVLAAILIDSHLSSAKYQCVTRSIWLLAGSVVFGFFYLLAIQL
jgi:hypothetical protein